jgi:RNA polymerase primary sigma factor
MALVKGSVPTVLLHLRRGARLTDRDDRGLTPLMLAAAAGRREICQLLLAEGADPSQQSPTGMTAANLAVVNGHVGLTALLGLSTPQPTVSPAVVELVPLDLDGFSEGNWESEDEAQVGRTGDDLLTMVRLAQAGLQRVLPDTAPDWSDVEIRLPARFIEKPMSATLRRWISGALRGQHTPADVRRVARRVPGLAALLEERGVAIAGDPLGIWIDVVLNERSAVPSADLMEAEVLEAIECLLHPRDCDQIRRREIDRVPHLDRTTEQSMFRALEEARRSVLRALLDSAALIELGRPNPASETELEAEVEAEDDSAPDFISSLAGLRGLDREEALALLSELDLDVILVERVVAELRRRKDPAGASLELQLGGYLTARDRVVTGGLPWVERSARKYVGKGVDLADLCQAGAIGLMRAAERFDPSLGYRFQTFAIWWIRQACSRIIADQANTIRMPVHVQEARVRYLRAEAALNAEGVKAPDLFRIAERAQLTELTARRCIRPRRQISLSRHGLEAWSERRPCPDSDPMIVTTGTDRRRHLAVAIAELPEREADVVRRRFGLGGYDAMTLEEIGVHYGVTRERIRQLEHKALWRLERSPVRRTLRALL